MRAETLGLQPTFQMADLPWRVRESIWSASPGKRKEQPEILNTYLAIKTLLLRRRDGERGAAFDPRPAR